MSHREVVIVPYQDGPYLVRGPVVLLDQDGCRIELDRRTIALCRCGKSRMRPFCDGTHRMIGFRVPSAEESPRARNSKPAEQTVGADALDGARSQELAPHRRPTSRSDRVSSNGGRSRTEALRTAESLLTAARVHLERNADGAADQRDGLESTWAEPAVCLVTGALEALRPFASDGTPQISGLVKELTELATVLRITGEQT